MKISEENKKFIESYGRHFLVAAIAVWTAKGLTLDNLFDVATLEAMVNAGLAAVVGPIVKVLIRKDKVDVIEPAPVKPTTAKKRATTK